MSKGWHLNPVRWVVNRLFAKTLSESGPALTFARLCTSRHLEDLQLLAFVMLLTMLGALWVWVAGLAGTASGPLAGAFLAAAIATINWCYQSGSRRIGAVDLFACEISVICRVALVVDFARKSVARAAPPVDPAATIAHHEFSSEEHYTPVYDGALTDLVPLDVNVVTHVTEFYTYRKTMMDQLRTVADGGAAAAVRETLIQMIYMQFLMYESGRLAIAQLVEFNPNRAEAMINILCSELALFAFLLVHFEGDYRGDRLSLRCAGYKDIVAKLYHEVGGATSDSWQRAQATAPELKARYDKMCADLGLVSDLAATPATAGPA